MAQPAQPNGKRSFNWGKFLVYLLIISAIIVLGWWLFFGFGNSDHATKLDYATFKKHVVLDKTGGNTTGDGWTVLSFRTDATHHTLFATLKDSNGHVGDYYTMMPRAMFDDLSKASTSSGTTNANWIYQVVNNGNGQNLGAGTHLVLDWDADIKNNFSKANYQTPISDAGLYEPKGRSIWVSLLISLIPTLLLVGLMFFMFRGARSMGGDGGILGGAGKSPAKRTKSNKRFSDVAGQEEVKEEVQEVVDFLKRPAKYKAAGARIPKGIMLGGAPGTGKTLMAKAVAGEAEVPFYYISASNFVEMFAGMGAKRVREMFKEARKNAPAILFIDEMDAVGRKRGSSLSGNDEREQTLNQILVEMDGMEETIGLLIIAATNRPEILDPALLRPGRFDRTITVNLPDIKEREAILRLHAKGKRISPDVDFKNIAKRTPRYSGAELENVINEATLLSVRERTDVITLDQVDEAIDRVMAGPAKKHRVITPEENRLVAIHEAGHAVVGLKVKDADIVQKITIIPRGDAGGYTLSIPEKEQYNYRKSQLEARVMGLLGGRAAEQAYYGVGEVTTGASDDIQKATNIARAMVTQFGMSILGPIAYEKPQGSQHLGMDRNSKDYSDALAGEIDRAIRDLVMTAEKKAIAIIKKNKKLIDLIVEELIEKETIIFEEIDYIHKNMKRPPKRISKKKEKSQSLDEIISEVKTGKPAKPKATTKKPVVKKKLN